MISTTLSIYLSIYLSIHPSIYLSIYLSIDLLFGRPNHCFIARGRKATDTAKAIPQNSSIKATTSSDEQGARSSAMFARREEQLKKTARIDQDIYKKTLKKQQNLSKIYKNLPKIYKKINTNRSRLPK